MIASTLARKSGIIIHICFSTFIGTDLQLCCLSQTFSIPLIQQLLGGCSFTWISITAVSVYIDAHIVQKILIRIRIFFCNI
ncbi:hypothetical protein BJP62_01630 [Jeongeupia sp. USM3]|nr:hypothetical protein BJP62_01630 [Jeongeupia sp. USM3]